MPPLVRSLPAILTVVAASAAPFAAVACGETPTLPPPPTVTSSGSASASSGASASASVTSAAGMGGAASTTGIGGSGGVAATSSASSGSGGSASDAGDAASDPDSPENCGTTVTQYAIDPSPHIAQCFPVTYSSNPPTSGPHYPIWGAFKTYSAPIPRGFTVHDLEHGAVVISYKCAGGCASEVAALQALVDARPADPGCVAPVKSRIVIAPDPLLATRFAAAAWGFALTSQCFDLPALGAFIDAHYGMGTENFCADGVDVAAPDAGIPADCGEIVDAGAGPG
jgi:hypothetical protein